MPDIMKGEILPTIRNSCIDFYIKGGRLFHYNGEFSTHIKYASVLKSDKPYIKVR